MESPQEYKKSFIIITPLQKPKNLKLIMINHVIYHVNHVIILTYEQAQQWFQNLDKKRRRSDK